MLIVSNFKDLSFEEKKNARAILLIHKKFKGQMCHNLYFFLKNIIVNEHFQVSNKEFWSFFSLNVSIVVNNLKQKKYLLRQNIDLDI